MHYEYLLLPPALPFALAAVAGVADVAGVAFALALDLAGAGVVIGFLAFSFSPDGGGSLLRPGGHEGGGGGGAS